jgi:hypothetical protein
VTWMPPPRPGWVRAVNAGDLAPYADAARDPFTVDGLMGEARVRQALDDFGDDDFLEPLGILVSGLEDEAELTILGRWLTRRFILRMLEVRLQLVDYVGRDPGVVGEPITEPLFVTGAPRTGTTILYNLLALDPVHRVPLGWELLRPVPPPDASTHDDDPRIALADEELRGPAAVTEGLDAIHVYGGRLPKECLSAMSLAFRSEEFTARYHVPTYADWLSRCDMRPAYEVHKLVLQVLGRRMPTARWVLKSPVHLHSLPTLLSVYPDARIAITHRDPLMVLPSVTSLVAMLRWAHSDRVDFAEIGRDHAARHHSDLDGLVTHVDRGTLDPARTWHGRYADFVEEPIGTVAKLYAHAGRDLPPPLAEQMARHLARQSQGGPGGHAYSFDDLGLDRAAERDRFARYQRCFAVPDE